jgi:predicted Zn-dependent protease
MKQARTIGDVRERRVADEINNRAATRLMWMPGARPVKVPKVTPTIIANNISINMPS